MAIATFYLGGLVGRFTSAAVAIVATLSVVLLVAQPAAAGRPSASSNRTGTPVPPWVSPLIDHPTPATGLLPPALWWGGTGHGPVVTIAQATSIFDAVWILREEAFGSNDRSVMAAFETGPALESDEVTCGCTTRDVRGNITTMRLFVPDERTFPATFLAEAVTTLEGAPYTQYLIITRQSASTPWMVVADPGQDGALRLDAARRGHGGFDAPASPQSGAHLPADLAAYWQSWASRGRAPAKSPLAAGKWTTVAGAKLAKTPSGSLTAFNGLIAKYRYRAGDADERWSFAVSAGTLTCGVVRYQTTWSALGGYTWQPPEQSNWGANVAPGFYQDVVDTLIAQPCFLERPGRVTPVVSGAMDPDTIQGQGQIATPNASPPSSQA